MISQVALFISKLVLRYCLLSSSGFLLTKMELFSWNFLFLFLSSSMGQESPCNDYAVNDCTQDPDAEFLAFNAGSQVKCQKHCEIQEECQFYAYHKKPTQNVDCHLFAEPFHVYAGHCDVSTGPLNQDPPGSCLTPQENSCEIEQHENCVLYGKILESNIQSPDVVTCEAFCKINQGEGCKYWEWSRERAACNLYDSAEKQCNIVFGPRNGAPGDCGTTTTGTTTTGSTAQPGTCGVTCPEEGLQLFADCDNCGGYLECYNGVMSTKTCPNCYLFDEGKGYCNQPTQVSCGDRPEDENCSAETKPGDCPYDNGYFKDAHNCGRYFVCKNGMSETFSCKNATFDGLYDYNLEWCNWPEKVDCEDRPICGGEPPEYTNCQCQGAETVTEFSCPNTPNVEFFIDPFNCQHMIVCHGGSQIHDAYCWDGQYFNYQSGTCVTGDGVWGEAYMPG